MRRKGTAIWMVPFKIEPIACFLGIMMILTLPLTDAQDTSEENHEIDLFISGEGSYSDMQFWYDDNLTTSVPNSTVGESQSIDVQLQSGGESYHWQSYPLRMDFSLSGDVHITIWATCNQSREIAFSLGFGKIEREGSGYHGHGYCIGTDTKLVHNDPVEFHVIITEEIIEEEELKEFHTGGGIWMEVTPFYQFPQLPSEVTILYNSTSHPSGMKINTTSVSINFSDSEVRDGMAFVGVNITDAFGVYDIANYNVKITDPLSQDFKSFNIAEEIIQENGQIILNLTWDMAGREAGNYIINVTAVDNNNNKWWKEETHYFNPLEGDNDPDNSKEEGSVQPFIPVIVIIILSIILGIGALVNKMREKPQSPK